MRTFLKQLLLSFFCAGSVSPLIGLPVFGAAMVVKGKAPGVKKGSILVFEDNRACRYFSHTR